MLGGSERAGHTKRMTARKLRLLRVSLCKFIANTVEQLYVALLWILLECGDERPRHGTSSLSLDACIRPVVEVSSVEVLPTYAVSASV